MKRVNHYIKILAAITLSIVAFAFLGCNSNNDEPQQLLSVHFSSEEETATVDASNSGIFIIIKTESEWIVEIEQTSNWCTSTTLSGSGNKNLWLTIKNNSLETSRTAHITVRTEEESKTLTLIQSGTNGDDGGGDDDGDDDDPALFVEFASSSPIAWDASGIGINIASNTQWAITTTYPSGTTAWCSASPQNGTDDASVWVTTTSNTLSSQRSATITISTATLQKTLTLQQNGKPAAPTGGYELPKIEDSKWYLEYNKGEFAMEYDITKKHAKWVAFPLHKGCYGNSGRTNAWRQDSRIPAEFRAVQGDFPSGYDRGHMCSSGERTKSVEMNQETFYYSNMSPQLSDLNQGIWGQLENFERKWTQGTNDTLYICCGGAITNNQPIIKYNNGLAIPKYYFKVFLRKRGNNTYHAIGFWYENKAYSQRTKAYFLSIRNELVRSVDEIEELTGLDFFHSLPKEIQDVVETQKNLNDWDWN